RFPMSTTSINGRPRKQLAEQIDRLEQAVSGLGDGLRQAVREATAQAVQEAVQGLVVELLTNPDLAAGLRASVGGPAPAAPGHPGPGWLSRLGAWLQTLPGKARRAWDAALSRHRGLVAGLAAGLVAAVAAWQARPLLGLTSWLAGKAAALAGRAGVAARAA